MNASGGFGQRQLDELLAGHLAAVTGADASSITATTRLAEDLHADSLDVVEVVEAVERDLRGRGFSARISERELVAVRTVGDLAGRLRAQLAPSDSETVS